ncbi:hypothetical protein [Enterobacter cloacae complex sp. 358K9]|uniref:hypothetical protein n=1 Tax=Enterobacter cloacae complex sp. 358K9 TaxID=3395826 RepID=UPI003CEB352E
MLGQVDIGKALYSKLSSSKGAALKHITSILDSDEQNIIYAPKKNLAEGWALAIAQTNNEDSELDEDNTVFHV